MQSKKVEEALSITHDVLGLLVQHPYAASAPLFMIKQLQSSCGELLSCLSILHSFELSGTPPPNRDAEDASPSLKRESIYELISKTLSQVVDFNTQEDSDNSSNRNSAARPPPPPPPTSGAPLRSRVHQHDQASTRKRKQRPQTPVRNAHSSTDKKETFDAICGCEDVVATLKQCILLPARLPFLFKGPRRPPQRILLYGPPGTGKTLLVTAAAQSTDPPCALLCVSAAQLLSKWVGESEKQLEKVFSQAKKLVKQQQHSERCVDGSACGSKRRCVIFFDEIDALCSARGHQSETELSRRIKTEFLLHLNCIQTDGILVMAATNLPWEIDSAIRRRFDRFVYVDLPSAKARLALLRKHLADPHVDHCLSPEEVKQIICKTARFSAADLVSVIQQALMKPLAPLTHCTHLRCATDEDWQSYLCTERKEEDSPVRLSASLHSSLQSILSDVHPIILNTKKRRDTEECNTMPAEKQAPTTHRRCVAEKDNSEIEDYRIPSHMKERKQFDTWYVPCTADEGGVSMNRVHLLPGQELPDMNDIEKHTSYIAETQVLVPPLRYTHFVEVLKDFTPSVTEHELDKFKKWRSKTSKDGH